MIFNYEVDGKISFELGIINNKILIKTIPVGDYAQHPMRHTTEIRLELETAKWLSIQLDKLIKLLENKTG